MSHPFVQNPPIITIAELEYTKPPEGYVIVKRGSHVLCAVTGEPILLEELRYWNVKRQEAYRDAHASLKRELELRAKNE